VLFNYCLIFQLDRTVVIVRTAWSHFTRPLLLISLPIHRHHP